ncbi:MAG: glycosyltransferase [Spirochaetia bacterium]|nr:glycosyltransferase [Spirochaetia bacterium]
MDQIANPSYRTFRKELENEFLDFLRIQGKLFPPEETLKIDLHCHDKNSDVPDEVLARIMEIPETWLETSDLLDSLKRNGCNSFTITNHNNARSCFEMQERGMDILTGAEYTCFIPDFNISIHVLTFGFSPEQHEKLNALRSNLYKFLRYAREHEIPTIWAHPLYFYSPKGVPPLDFFEKMSVIFERFEIINGQRNTEQNLLFKKWLDHLSQEKIARYAKKYDIDIDDYCIRPYEKSMSGGSDCHMGIFAGYTGTYLHVPGLSEKKDNSSLADLSLQAIRDGKMSPYGSVNENEKLTVAFLDYFCQVSLNMKDPGMMRILLHKGKSKDKLLGFLIANGIFELRQHKITMSFLKTYHEAFRGSVPHFTKKIFIKKDYLNIFNTVRDIAKFVNEPSNLIDPEFLGKKIDFICNDMNSLFMERLEKKIQELVSNNGELMQNPEEFVRQLEIAADIRKYTEVSAEGFSIKSFVDGLSFPMLAASLIYSAIFTSAHVLYNSRELLREMSLRLKSKTAQPRILWLTDTFQDKNGVAASLKSLHEEILKNNLPIDIGICSQTAKPGPHLAVFKPLIEFTLPFYKQQVFRLPNILDIHKFFQNNGYDRIICSTEGPMGIAAVLLKKAFRVRAYFYLHTDWLTYIRQNLNFNQHMINRVRRLLRIFYRQFDGIFVLNSDQKKWLSGRDMSIKKGKLFLTAHWADSFFSPEDVSKAEIFGCNPKEKILLFAGRISPEKGVLDLPYIYREVKKFIPEIRIAVAGTGPSEEILKKQIPDLITMGWVEPENLPGIYSASDMLLLPSGFDTFGLVLLEAMQCGLPVAAYEKMGPKDIIEDKISGYLVKSKKQMVKAIIKHFENQKKIPKMRKNCIKRAAKYSSEKIIKNMMNDLKIT